MKRKVIGWLLCCLYLLGGMCVACSDKEKEEATIVGVVRDSETNWPIKDVSVELYRTGRNAMLETSVLTGANGYFN